MVVRLECYHIYGPRKDTAPQIRGNLLPLPPPNKFNNSRFIGALTGAGAFATLNIAYPLYCAALLVASLNHSHDNNEK